MVRRRIDSDSWWGFGRFIVGRERERGHPSVIRRSWYWPARPLVSYRVLDAVLDAVLVGQEESSGSGSASLEAAALTLVGTARGAAASWFRLLPLCRECRLDALRGCSLPVAVAVAVASQELGWVATNTKQMAGLERSSI